MMLPLITPVMPDITNTGVLELLANMLATPAANSAGGELMSDTVELGGQEKPAPRSVIVQVETLRALEVKVMNNMTLSWTPETDEMGAESEARLSVAQVVVNLYRKFAWRVNARANAEDF